MLRRSPSDETRAKLRAASKAWQRRSGHGTRIGNLRAKKARESRKAEQRLEEELRK